MKVHLVVLSYGVSGKDIFRNVCSFFFFFLSLYLGICDISPKKIYSRSSLVLPFFLATKLLG